MHKDQPNGRHAFSFNSKEINAFKKTYKKRSHYNKPAVIAKTLARTDANTETHTPVEVKHSNPFGILSRLEHLAAKIDSLETSVNQLIKIWS